MFGFKGGTKSLVCALGTDGSDVDTLGGAIAFTVVIAAIFNVTVQALNMLGNV